MVQFEDLSLIYFDLPSGSQKWIREESLSKVKQVEVLTQDAMRIESELEYVRNVKHKAPLSSVPTLIVNRYKENFNYLINHAQSFLGQFTTQGS